jgi:hypothetical protein
MIERRAQWIRFFEAALGGLCADPNMTDNVVTAAERMADTAMARLDARDFPKPKVALLLRAAEAAWDMAEHHERGRIVPDHLMVNLRRAIAAMAEET